MITCPWCGTNYAVFQPNCQNCGGPLPVQSEETSPAVPDESLPIPPAAPRQISNRYVWRLFSADGAWIAALVLALVGIIFGIVGLGLTIAIITALIGIPFLLLGLVLLVAGGLLFFGRYQKAQKVVSVLRDGAASEGQITELRQNYSVQINGRSPWIIAYAYQVNGQSFAGKVTTLNDPGQRLQVGKAVRILYLPSDPNWSSIYPHP
ncbi:MAG: DUF3592 domain-containing protein [Anaerolineaceae bacterium]|nr:DUF3592 domain-containing protein [Anaerolineaceae bacterium]